MKNDPLVGEARQTGQKYIDSFKGDWKAIIADSERRTRKEGRKSISLPPRRPQPGPTPTKKSG